MAGGVTGGFVGMVKPTTQGSGSHDALVRMLPASVRTHTVYCGIKDGTVEEFQSVMPEYERGVAEAARLEVDLIHPEGTPPFMLHRYVPSISPRPLSLVKISNHPLGGDDKELNALLDSSQEPHRLESIDKLTLKFFLSQLEWIDESLPHA